MSYKKYLLFTLVLILSSEVLMGKDYAVIIAANKGNISNIRKLLKKRKANINIKSKKNGYTALMCAIKNHHDKIVKFLLNKGASVEPVGSDSETALSLSEKYMPKYVNVITESLSSDSEMTGSSSIFDIDASAKLDKHPTNYPEDVLKELRIKNEKFNTSGWTPLAQAIANENLPKIIWLVETLGVNINAKNRETGWTPLMKAVLDGKKNIVVYLLEHGADPTIKNSRGQDALVIAQNTYKGVDSKIVDLLKFTIKYSKEKSGEELSEELVKLVKSNELDKIRVLLGLKSIDLGYDDLSFKKNSLKINHKDVNATPLLIIAIKNGNYNIVRLLLNYGANIYIPYSKFKNVYAYAVSNNFGNIAILIKKYMDKDIQSKVIKFKK